MVTNKFRRIHYLFSTNHHAGATGVHAAPKFSDRLRNQQQATRSGTLEYRLLEQDRDGNLHHTHSEVGTSRGGRRHKILFVKNPDLTNVFCDKSQRRPTCFLTHDNDLRHKTSETADVTHGSVCQTRHSNLQKGAILQQHFCHKTHPS